MSRELIDRIAEKLEQVSDDNEFLYRKSTGEIICRDPEFLDESTLEDIEVNWKEREHSGGLRIRFSISGYATIGLLTGIIVSEI